MSPIRRSVLTAAASCAALGVLAGTAAAVHWPFFGGDAGRSGNQPVRTSQLPVLFRYAKTAASDQTVKSSILTSAGISDVQRVIYGTANGSVHLRMLDGGAAVGPEAGVAVDDGQSDGDIFGQPGTAASVSFADTSGPSGLGQVFAVHNDDDQSVTGDIAVAQIDETDGSKVQDVPVAGTGGFTIMSSAVATGPDANGNRSLFFVATDGTQQKLFKVPIANAGAKNAQIGAATATGDVNANPLASPTLVFLRGSGGDPTAYVAVGTTDNDVKTFAVSDLSAGPQSGDLGGDAQTPSVPVTPGGQTPSPSEDVKTAPFLYVAAATANDTTTVYRLAQQGNGNTLAAQAQSEALQGAPAPALATDQLAAEQASNDASVAVTTARNLFVRKAADLSARAQFDAESDLTPGVSGFSQTTAAVSNGFAYVTNDEGGQLVLRLSNAQPVADADFEEERANSGELPDRSGVGQPSVSRGFVQYGGGKGLFVYRGGFNTFVGTSATDDAHGTRGDDTLDGGLAADDLDGLQGGDTVAGGSEKDRMNGGDGVDTMSGGAGDDVMKGDPDRDFMTGDAGADNVDGEQGSNVIDGGIGNDFIRGGENADSLNGGSDADRIFGGAGNDGITGASGQDRLFGSTGDDRIEGGLGQDVISGGDGGDNIVSIDGQPDLVNCGRGRDVVRADGGDTIRRNCENVIERPGEFGKAPDQESETRDLGFAGQGGQRITGDGGQGQELRGSDAGDTIDSPIAGDRLFGLGGTDLLSGNSGDDRAEGGEETDVLSGGPGKDELLGGAARDFVEGGPDEDRLEGGPGSNIMNGAQGNDVLIGGNFADSLNGGSDEDLIRGGEGGDGITGASGRDRLFGEDGDDRIEGGLGQDVISAGAGGDNIVAADGQRDEIRCGPGRDVLRADGEDQIARDCELVIARVGDAYVVVRR